MEFNSQICTTEEQSKQLLALGLKRETADMMFSVLVKDFRGKDVPNAERVYSLCTWYEETSMSVGLEKREYIPAWSLHRLIEMCNKSQAEMTIGIYCDEVTADGDLFEVYDNTYDNLISIIEWLIGLGKFNENYLNIH